MTRNEITPQQTRRGGDAIQRGFPAGAHIWLPLGLLDDEWVLEEVNRVGPLVVVDLECLLENVDRIDRDVARNDGLGRGSNLSTTCPSATRYELEDKPLPTLNSACICVRSGHGRWPVSISTTRQPTLHISAFFVYEVCLTTSGAIQKTDPCSDCRPLRPATVDLTRVDNKLLSTFFEMPKSAILMPPLLSTRMLAPLMSRWMMSRSCKYSSPVRVCLIQRWTSASSKGPHLLRIEDTVPPGTYSRKIFKCWASTDESVIDVGQSKATQARAWPPTQVLHDMLVLEVFEQLNLALKRDYHALAALFAVAAACAQLDLLDSHEHAGLRVEPKEDLAE